MNTKIVAKIDHFSCYFLVIGDFIFHKKIYDTTKKKKKAL